MKQGETRKLRHPLRGMRAGFLADHYRSECEEAESLDELPHEYPFCLIEILAEPSGGSEKRVATYVEFGGIDDRESRLFVERSPPSMNWIEEVFELIRNTEARGIISGGLHEIWIDCEDKIKLLEDQPALIDHQDEKVYFDDGSTGNTTTLKKWRSLDN